MPENKNSNYDRFPEKQWKFESTSKAPDVNVARDVLRKSNLDNSNEILKFFTEILKNHGMSEDVIKWMIKIPVTTALLSPECGMSEKICEIVANELKLFHKDNNNEHVVSNIISELYKFNSKIWETTEYQEKLKNNFAEDNSMNNNPFNVNQSDINDIIQNHNNSVGTNDDEDKRGNDTDSNNNSSAEENNNNDNNTTYSDSSSESSSSSSSSSELNIVTLSSTKLAASSIFDKITACENNDETILQEIQLFNKTSKDWIIRLKDWTERVFELMARVIEQTKDPKLAIAVSQCRNQIENFKSSKAKTDLWYREIGYIKKVEMLFEAILANTATALPMDYYHANRHLVILELSDILSKWPHQMLAVDEALNQLSNAGNPLDDAFKVQQLNAKLLEAGPNMRAVAKDLHIEFGLDPTLAKNYSKVQIKLQQIVNRMLNATVETTIPKKKKSGDATISTQINQYGVNNCDFCGKSGHYFDKCSMYQGLSDIEKKKYRDCRSAGTDYVCPIKNPSTPKGKGKGKVNTPKNQGKGKGNQSGKGGKGGKGKGKRNKFCTECRKTTHDTEECYWKKQREASNPPLAIQQATGGPSYDKLLKFYRNNTVSGDKDDNDSDGETKPPRQRRRKYSDDEDDEADFSSSRRSRSNSRS